jgi:hypothetical protein
MLEAGDGIRHFIGCSTFAEYAVMPEIALAKISPEVQTGSYGQTRSTRLSGASDGRPCGLPRRSLSGAYVWTWPTDRRLTRPYFGTSVCIGQQLMVGAPWRGTDAVCDSFESSAGRLQR